MQEALYSAKLVSMAELIPSHVQKVFARVYHASRTITPTQLVVAVESHAGHGEGAEVDLSEASAAVAKAVAMDSKGKRLEIPVKSAGKGSRPPRSESDGDRTPTISFCDGL